MRGVPNTTMTISLSAPSTNILEGSEKTRKERNKGRV